MMKRILFIRSSVDGHLDCFYLLAIMNSNTHCYKHLCTGFCVDMLSLLLSISLGVEMLSHMVTLFNYLRNCTILQSLQHLVLSDFFYYSHPSRCEVVCNILEILLLYLVSHLQNGDGNIYCVITKNNSDS